MEKGLARRGAIWIVAAGLVSALLYASTLQSRPNGSPDPYATDVGEIQNALPRWGTLHFTGYPQYSLTGSAVVTALRAAGVGPAAAASAVSLLWGALAVAAAAALAIELGAVGWAAFLGALVFGTSTSMWMDSSVAEVHTLTMFLTALSLALAVRVRRAGGRGALYALALAFSQGVVHMRPVLLLAPALALLVWPQRALLRRHLVGCTAVALCAPLIYVYMPLREMAGSEWTFGQTSTWRGFWEMVLDTKAERILQPVSGVGEGLARLRVTVGLLVDDVHVGLLAAGLAGLFAAGWGVGAALSLVWLPYALLALVIWEGQVSDALLAVKLPVALMAGTGIALFVTWLWRRVPIGGVAAGVVVAGMVVASLGARSERVRLVTEDARLEPVVARMRASVGAMGAGDRVVVVAPWGHTFWALAYAKAFEGAFRDAEVVDHNADMGAFVAARRVLAMPSDTLFVLTPEWWRDRGAEVLFEEPDPGVIVVRGTGAGAPGLSAGAVMDVNDDVAVADGTLTPAGSAAMGAAGHELELRLEWIAKRRPRTDYSVAVHLLDGDEVLAQADSVHPADGWSPTSAWAPGTRVRDAYALSDVDPRADAVRVTLYRTTEDGFENGAWLTLPVPGS